MKPDDKQLARAYVRIQPYSTPLSPREGLAKGTIFADLYLHENMAAEQKARSTYEWLINLSDDPGVTETLRFLREREIVHFQRFGETLVHVQDVMQSKKYY